MRSTKIAKRVTSAAARACMTLAAALLFFGLSQAQASSSVSASCEALGPWLAAKAQSLSAMSMKERSEAAEREFNLRRDAASKLFERFEAGRLDRSALDSCLSTVPDRQNFYNTLQAVFFQRSLAKLSAARGPALRAFAAMVDARTQGGRTIPFRLTGHTQAQAPVELKGGFHRGSGSIFMDLGRVSPDEWLVIFIHELAHGLDDRLPEAVRAYNAQKDVEDFAEWAVCATEPAFLPAETRAKLDRWLEAGLGRGLFAEYRAWHVTLVLYEEGLREGLWDRIGWMETLLSQRPAQQELGRFIYVQLDTRFTDPADGIFSHELIQNGLKAVRARYRDGSALPPLGALGEILLKAGN
ncbi:MAG: hypothetical protein NDJ89_15765 [Oligoflexia bacterium]|nr:hypothetical protein [Oligoflexia bacterium]